MKCPICGGDTLNDLVVKGKMTNDEWRRTCSTEEFAEFLTKIILDDKRFRMTMVGGVNETKLWLKQPHSEVAE